MYKVVKSSEKSYKAIRHNIFSIPNYTSIPCHKHKSDKDQIIKLFEKHLPENLKLSKCLNLENDTLYIHNGVLYSTNNNVFDGFLPKEFDYWLSLFYNEIKIEGKKKVKETIDNSNSVTDSWLDYQLKKIIK
jgi:hypothetical protein